MAVGLVRPLILIPASWISEMPLDMLEAVIAHELAHLARRDLCVNWLQRIVETLLFYHPAVWWLSQRVRVERELCADELAVAITGKRLKYVQALQHIAAKRRADVRPLLATFLRGETKMRLLERVQRVLGQPSDQRPRLWPAGILAAALPMGLWAALAIGGAVLADEGDDEKKVELRIKKKVDEDDTAFTPRLIRKPVVEVEEVIEQKILDKDGKLLEHKIIGGKPRVELRFTKDDAPGGDRRVDELAALVKRLSAQVERLQNEVAEFKGREGDDKRVRERAAANEWEAEARKKLETYEREFEQQARVKELAAREQAKAKELAAEAKERAMEQKERAELRARIEKERTSDSRIGITEKDVEPLVRKLESLRLNKKDIEKLTGDAETTKAEVVEAIKRALDRKKEAVDKQKEFERGR
jgi:hypothetical protein